MVKSVTSGEYLQYVKNVTHVTEKQVNLALKGNLSLVIHFNADYSSENRRAMKGFHKASKRLVKKDLEAEIGFIDCEKLKATCEQLGAYHYPKTKLISFGRIVDIPMKGRTQQLVVDSILDKVRGPGTYLESRKNMTTQRKKSDRFFCYIGHKDEDFALYQKFAAAFPFIEWFYSFDRGDIAHANGIYFYDEREGTSDMINGPHGPLFYGRMFLFVKKYLYLLRSIPDYAMDRIFADERFGFILFYPDSNEERGVQIPWWHGAIKIKNERLTLQIPMKKTNSHNNRNVVELRHFVGVENPSSPAVRIVHRNDKGRWVYYQLRSKITVESTLEFYEDWKNGKLKEFHRSERPEKTHGVIKQLVGKNYRKSVQNKKYHVLSIIYSSENKHISERILKITTIVAKVLARFQYLKFVKINAEYNSDEILPQRGFPFIRMYRQTDNKGEFAEFDGLYSAKDFSQWICDQIGEKNPFDEMISNIKKNRKKGGKQKTVTEEQPQNDI